VTPDFPSSPAIDLYSVSKNFGRMAALRDVTAAFTPGQIYCLLGENGAGKSTLLRILAGLMQPTRGRLLVLGSADTRAVAGRIGYMPHASMLYDEMNALENLRYFSGLYGLQNEGEAETACQEAIRLVGLDPVLRRRVGQYSQGMRQRLSLARALVHQPELLLLDEPFSNVDAASGQHMVEVLAALRNAARTVVLVTHQPSLVAGVADEFITLAGGRIAACSHELESGGEGFHGKMTMRLEWRAGER